MAACGARLVLSSRNQESVQEVADSIVSGGGSAVAAAALGIGGLAVALAIRPTLENLIGGITIYAARPVSIGDFCRFGTVAGTVEEIGIERARAKLGEADLVLFLIRQPGNIDIPEINLKRYAV